MHLPPIYLMEVDAVNAHALGFMSEGSVILYRGLVHQMTTAELQFIIGHELAHIKCGHTSWLALTHSTSSAMAGHKLYLISHLLLRAWSRSANLRVTAAAYWHVLILRSPPERWRDWRFRIQHRRSGSSSESQPTVSRHPTPLKISSRRIREHENAFER